MYKKYKPEIVKKLTTHFWSGKALSTCDAWQIDLLIFKLIVNIGNITPVEGDENGTVFLQSLDASFGSYKLFGKISYGLLL